MNGLYSREHSNWRRFTDVTALVLQTFVFNSKSYSCFLARNLITMVFYSNLHWNACWAVSVLKVFRYDDTWYKFLMLWRCKINEIGRSRNLLLDIVTLTMVAPLMVCNSFIRPLLDHVDMFYKEVHNFFHQNFNGNPLSVNPTKCSNTNRHQTIHPLLADDLLECLTILWSWRVKG